MKAEEKKNVGRQNAALIYKILLNYASKGKPLSIRGSEGKPTIQRYLADDYGVDLNHHTISDILHAMKDFGLVDIEGGAKRGKWYPIREMDDDSTAILLLSMYGNNNLTGPQIEAIEDQLAPVIGNEVTESLRAIMPKSVTTWNRMIPSFFQVINDAIKLNRQIGYVRAFNALDNTTFVPKDEKKKRKRIVNPLGITCFRGDFYMFYSQGGRDEVAFVRLDNIGDVWIERSQRLTPEGFNPKAWLQHRPFAFSDPIGEFEIASANREEGHNPYRDLIYVRQYFGNEPKLWFDEKDGRIHAIIKTSRMCFKWWYIDYSHSFDIISPDDIKSEIAEYARKLLSVVS